MQPSRSSFLAAAASAALLRAQPAGAAGLEATVDPDSAAAASPAAGLRRLREGNARYVSGAMLHPRQTPARREAVAPKQRPFASIVDCSDSRTAPEQVFDQGVGDLFVVRLAGNVVDGPAIGSLEFATLHFGTPLVVVLGHSRCGAIAATLDALDAGGEAPGSIGTLVELIAPNVRGIPKGPNRVAAATDANAKAVAAKIAASGVFAPKAAAGGVRIVAAHLDVASGKVTWLR